MTLGAAGLGAAGLGASAGLSATFLTADLVGDTTRKTLVAVRDGSITGLSVGLSEARATGSIKARITINGVAAALFVQINTAVSEAVATQAVGIDTFVAGDLIGIEIEVSADWTPTTADATVMVEVQT